MKKDEEFLEDDTEDQTPARTRSRRCPKCDSADVRRSNTEGWLVSVNQMFGRWPFRCRNCRTRFFLHAPPPPNS